MIIWTITATTFMTTMIARVIVVKRKTRITLTLMKNCHKEINHILMYTSIRYPINFVPLSSTISTSLQNGGELL